MIEQLGQMLPALRKIILQQSAPAQVIADRLTAAASSGGFDLALAKIEDRLVTLDEQRDRDPVS